MSYSCNIDCSWSGGNLNDVVQYHLDSDENLSLPKKTVSLLKSDDNKPCMINIKCNNGSDVNISAIDILCNAKRMEIYSITGEYLFTEEGIFIEELENKSLLYMLQKTLNPALKAASLKMVSLQNKDKLFVHSIYVTLENEEKSQKGQAFFGSSIDLDKVKAMMPDDASGMSKGAQSLMSAMESFQKTQNAASQQLNSMAMMMSMFTNLGASNISSQSSMLPTSSQKLPEKNSASEGISDGSQTLNSRVVNLAESSTSKESSSHKNAAEEENESETRNQEDKIEHGKDLKRKKNGKKSDNSNLNDQNSKPADTKINSEVKSENSQLVKQESSIMTQSLMLSDSMHNMRDMPSSVSNESLASYSSNDDTEVLLISDNKAVAIESNKILTMQDLKQFEKKILGSINDSENRIKSNFNNRISEVEKNINSRLDELMNVLKNRSNDSVN